MKIHNEDKWNDMYGRGRMYIALQLKRHAGETTVHIQSESTARKSDDLLKCDFSADKPIPTCVKQYGVPFLLKYVSEQMMRLQPHGFQWEDEPFEVLLQRYPRCKTALQWWCGERCSDENGVQKISRFSIYRNRFLKEFIMQNSPDFPISNKCCEYAKKKPAKRIVKEHDADLDNGYLTG